MAHSPVSKSRRNKDGNGKNGHTLYSLPTLYRGIYNRVAEKVGCDPSYVSRVARGERTSQAVAKALETEIRRTMAVGSRQFMVASARDGNARGRALRA
jgi:hypothetical protein